MSSNEIVIERPNTAELATHGSALMARAKSIVVSDQETHGVALEFLRDICCDPALGFATHVDVLGTLEGKPCAVNWKTGLRSIPAYAVQIAGEAIASCGASARIAERIGIHLRDDGMYQAMRYREREDFDVFLAALRIWQWKDKTR